MFVRKAQEMELPAYDVSFGNQSYPKLLNRSDEDTFQIFQFKQCPPKSRAPLFSSLSLRNSRNSKPFCYELDGVALSPSKSTSSLVPLAPLVPIETDFSPAELETIRWMMQKVSLRQDLD